MVMALNGVKLEQREEKYIFFNSKLKTDNTQLPYVF